MFCFKCGANMPDTVTACPQCGAPVQNAPSPQPPAAALTPAPASPARMSAPLTPAGYGQEPKTDGKATASMICGILSITCFGFLAGIPAIILGHLSKSSIAASMVRLKGDGMALAGLIMGYLSVVLGVFVIIAAIAIPSLLRSRMAANTSAAASTVRTVNTAQVVYNSNYPSRGYAASLSALGAGQPPAECSSSSNATYDHACLIDSTLACPSPLWCTKAGYRYHLVGICDVGRACTGYVITATPVSDATGTKSFCSTDDAVIRYHEGSPLVAALPTAEDCQSWPPLE